MKKYDMTTSSGISELIRCGLIKTSPYGAFFPLLDLAGELLKKFFSNPKEQSDAITQIIKNGKESGVDRMEIKASNINGLKIDFGKDVDGSIVAGADNKMTIHVKYK